MDRKTPYEAKSFEKKWQEKWEADKLYSVNSEKLKNRKPYYCLDMFPYPSGSGLHVGHWRGYVLSDVIARFKMMQGYKVLHPMGWDSFGLPAENYAIKTGVQPKESTKQNISNIKRQLKDIGCIYDWDHEIATSHEDYYHWTQWIFLQMFKKGLAYKEKYPVNWCNNCKAVLANEEVEGGKCERCGGSDIEIKTINQWMLRITKYADRLIDDLDTLDWPEKVKEMQRNWIGRSYGASVKFKLQNTDKEIEVFTTRVDTLFGATYVAMAPEHPLVKEIVTAEQKQAVDDYIKSVKTTSNVERNKDDREKTGVFSGAYAINPCNNEVLPIWITDYVLMGYGTGIIMAVPAHDTRDFAFAKKFNIPIKEVIYSKNAVRNEDGTLKEAYTGPGKLINSSYIDGLTVEAAKEKMIEELSKAGKADKKVNYHLRDWIFARQRYWGEPIPVVYCEKCGIVPIDESELPLKLPYIENYKPTGTLESPLASCEEFVNTTCPHCGGPAKRETDTMPQWAGSCWYFIRYVSPRNEKAFVDPDEAKEWLPVNMYVGGIEHAVLHLLYARFWTKFLYDEGFVHFKEPFTKLFNQGMVNRFAYHCDKCNKWLDVKEVTSDGACPTCGTKITKSIEKMSKSKLNGVSPDELVNEYGVDSLRLYELFMGDPVQDSIWNDDGIKGCYTFLKKAWGFVCDNEYASESSLKAKKLTHKLMKNVKERMEAFKLNTAVSAFMEFINEAYPIKQEFSKDLIETFLITLSPYAPHIAEELWRNRLEHQESIFYEVYPEFDSELAKEDLLELPIQINGKLRDVLSVQHDLPETVIKEKVFGSEKVQKYLEGKEVRKFVYVKNKIVSLVI